MMEVKKWLQMSKKAIFGALVTSVAVFITREGWTLDTTIGEVVSALPAGLVNGVVVWWTTNKVGSVNRKR